MTPARRATLIYRWSLVFMLLLTSFSLAYLYSGSEYQRCRKAANPVLGTRFDSRACEVLK